MSDRAANRLALGAAAVLTPRQAAELLPLADDEAIEWLRRRRLVRSLLGREVVIWGDVVEAVRDVPAPPEGVRRKVIEDAMKHAAMLACENCDRKHPEWVPLFGWAHIAKSGLEHVCKAERIWDHLRALASREGPKGGA